MVPPRTFYSRIRNIILATFFSLLFVCSAMAAEGDIIWEQTSNPTTGTDIANKVVSDASGVYIVGYEGYGFAGGMKMRIEKRSHTDGNIIWEKTFNPRNQGYAAINDIAIDQNFLYIAGANYVCCFNSDLEWRVEKRALTDGSLVWSMGDNFSYGDFRLDIAFGITVDSSGVYIVGREQSGGTVLWRNEKRSLTDGSVIWSNSQNTGGIWAYGVAVVSVAVDSSGMYATGPILTGGKTQWHIIKLSLLDGNNILWSQATNFNSVSNYPQAISANSSGVYVIGSVIGNNPYWGVIKIDQNNGNIIWDQIEDNVTSGYPYDVDISNSNNIYIAGYNRLVSLDPRWRIEKRNIDGILQSQWPQEINPSGNIDVANGVSISSLDDGLYVVGFASTPSSSDTSWRIEKRELNAETIFQPSFSDTDGDGYPSDQDCDDSNPNIHPGATELCNNINDDCDDLKDEDFPNLNTVCSAGTGDCAGSGHYICNADGTGTVCNATPGLPSPEVCDGVDNNCDDVVDEGCNEDSDGDGLNNSLDPCPYDPNNDGDWDGVCGDVDNCPEYFNQDQIDSDNDGIGDGCALDLTIKGIEATQAIQAVDYSNKPFVGEVPLVANKATWIRVFIDLGSTYTGHYVHGVTAKIKRTNSTGDTTLCNSSNVCENSPYPVFIDAYSNPKRSEISHTLNFLLPSDWTKPGTIYLKIQVIGESEPERFQGNNERGPISIEFKERKPLNVMFVPVRVKEPSSPDFCTQPDGIDFWNTARFVVNTYPIPKLQMWESSVMEFDGDGYEIGTEDWGSELLSKLWWLNLFTYDPAPDMKYYGLVCKDEINFIGADYGGLALSNRITHTGDEAWGFRDGSNFGGETMAHEIGHNLGREHAPSDRDSSGKITNGACGDPEKEDGSYPQYNGFYRSSIGEFGFDRDDVYSPSYTYDFMSYCGSDQWISPYTYEALFNEFAP